MAWTAAKKREWAKDPANKERIRGYYTRYYEKNKDEILEKQKVKRKENPKVRPPAKGRDMVSRKKYVKEYYDNPVNKEAARQKSREYYKANRESIREKERRKRAEKPEVAEAQRIRAKEWRKRNPDKVRQSNMKRLGLIKAAFVDKVDKKALLIACGYVCQMCGVTVQVEDRTGDNHAHLDHIIPLSKGGIHAQFNCQILCRKCNLSKNNKTSP